MTELKSRSELVDIIGEYNQEAEYYANRCLRLEKELDNANQQIAHLNDLLAIGSENS